MCFTLAVAVGAFRCPLSDGRGWVGVAAASLCCCQRQAAGEAFSEFREILGPS